MLTRELVEDRLLELNADPYYIGVSEWDNERLALETALALYEERDEAIRQRDNWIGTQNPVFVENLLAENRLLLKTLKEECANCQADGIGIQTCLEGYPNCYVRNAIENLAPLTAAEAERVKRLEAVAEAAKALVDARTDDVLWNARKEWMDKLCAALAAVEVKK